MATPAGAKTATNVADVNGIKLERTIEVDVQGGTTGDGSTPAPTPSATTPAPQSGSTAPSPEPSTTTPSVKPSPTTRTSESQPSKQTKLAKTGANAEIAATLVIMIAAFGVVIYIISLSRKDDN